MTGSPILVVNRRILTAKAKFVRREQLWVQLATARIPNLIIHDYYSWSTSASQSKAVSTMLPGSRISKSFIESDVTRQQFSNGTALKGCILLHEHQCDPKRCLTARLTQVPAKWRPVSVGT
jgi:hypothetical protein